MQTEASQVNKPDEFSGKPLLPKVFNFNVKNQINNTSKNPKRQQGPTKKATCSPKGSRHVPNPSPTELQNMGSKRKTGLSPDDPTFNTPHPNSPMGSSPTSEAPIITSGNVPNGAIRMQPKESENLAPKTYASPTTSTVNASNGEIPSNRYGNRVPCLQLPPSTIEKTPKVTSVTSTINDRPKTLIPKQGSPSTFQDVTLE